MKLHILRKIAKEWIKQIDKNPEERIVHPLNHIKSIDGIDCYIRLHFESSSHTIETTSVSKYSLLMKITPYLVNDRSDSLLWNYFFFCNNDENIVINNETDLAHALRAYSKMISNLQFDRLSCFFCAPMNYMIETELRNVFSISDSLTEAWEECSICMNHTLTKTSCNHFVCVPCADKSCYVTEKTCCPICRKENALEYIHIEA
jgi:hypothetical protein